MDNYANRRKIADELAIGDIVERHISDGDCVLFNRKSESDPKCNGSNNFSTAAWDVAVLHFFLLLLGEALLELAVPTEVLLILSSLHAFI